MYRIIIRYRIDFRKIYGIELFGGFFTSSMYIWQLQLGEMAKATATTTTTATPAKIAATNAHMVCILFLLTPIIMFALAVSIIAPATITTIAAHSRQRYSHFRNVF